MPDTQGRPIRMNWSGVCDHCLTVVTVSPHPDSTDAQSQLVTAGPDAWGPFSHCLVCDDGDIDWMGSDPVEVGDGK